MLDLDPDLEPLADAEIREVLRRYRFDTVRFREGRERLRRGVAAASNWVTGELRPPGDGEVLPLPPPDSSERLRLEQRGREAIGRGEVAAVVLNGGMATRFGGVVKAAVEALPGRSFLQLKLGDLRTTARRSGGRIPVWLMNSFATDAATRRLLAELPDGLDRDVDSFPQSVSIRLEPAGPVFVGKDGRPSLYAPGHGDLCDALRQGTLAVMAAAGVRSVVMSNVDNLAAGVDPVILGRHLEAQAQMTVEVVRKERGDRGGAPAWLDGRLQIIEGMRFPPAFDQDTIPVFNTNTFVLDRAALDRDFPLDLFFAKKSVDGRDAIQFERLAGQLTAHLRSVYVEVPRSGPHGRFLPAKDQEEIAARRGQVEEVLRARGVL